MTGFALFGVSYNHTSYGIISNNTAVDGGGVHNSYGSFTLFGGVILDNTAISSGGGVYNGVQGSFTLFGGAISKNNTKIRPKENGGGGGVHNQGDFTMSGGTISNNICT
ncbi:MAG: hypothetical protein FWG55_00115 [Candidatus Bathyarchaeota archaeon]|nr:hypothetical protein [Candidatus Termiticorpusculum sp.]